MMLINNKIGSYQGCTHQNMIEIKRDEESREKTWNVPMLLRKVCRNHLHIRPTSSRPFSTSTGVLWHWTVKMPWFSSHIPTSTHLYNRYSFLYIIPCSWANLVFVIVKYKFCTNILSSNILSSNNLIYCLD
jgi:hypothetical protein